MLDMCIDCIYMNDGVCNRLEKIKTEAVKEFAEKLKAFAYEYVYSFALYSEQKNKTRTVVEVSKIDELLNQY